MRFALDETRVFRAWELESRVKPLSVDGGDEGGGGGGDRAGEDGEDVGRAAKVESEQAQRSASSSTPDIACSPLTGPDLIRSGLCNGCDGRRRRVSGMSAREREGRQGLRLNEPAC